MQRFQKVVGAGLTTLTVRWCLAACARVHNNWRSLRLASKNGVAFRLTVRHPAAAAVQQALLARHPAAVLRAAVRHRPPCVLVAHAWPRRRQLATQVCIQARAGRHRCQHVRQALQTMTAPSLLRHESEHALCSTHICYTARAVPRTLTAGKSPATVWTVSTLAQQTAKSTRKFEVRTQLDSHLRPSGNAEQQLRVLERDPVGRRLNLLRLKTPVLQGCSSSVIASSEEWLPRDILDANTH